MNCEQVDELLGAYALDAVDDDERAEIEAHLETCEHHGELAALRAVALSLAMLPAGQEPPAALEGRIMASIEAGPEALRPARSPRPGPRGMGVFLRWPAAAAAAMVIAVLGLAGGMVLARAGEDAPPTLVYVSREGGAWVRVERLGDASLVHVTMSGLQRRPPAEAYQLWAIRDDRWISVGVCNTNEDSWWRGSFDFVARASDEFVLTVEPAGGSLRPTGEPVLGLSAPRDEWPLD